MLDGRSPLDGPSRASGGEIARLCRRAPFRRDRLGLWSGGRTKMNAMTRPAFLTIGFVGAALAATGVVLWAAYGEAVFVDILLSGIAGCFG
jgi:hypothetical protein